MIKIGPFVITTKKQMVDATTEFVEYHNCYFDGPVTVVGDHVALIHCDIRVKEGDIPAIIVKDPGETDDSGEAA